MEESSNGPQPSLDDEMETALRLAQVRVSGGSNGIADPYDLTDVNRKVSNGLCLQLQEEHRKALLRRDFQVQSLGLQARLQQKLWGQERTLLVQESQHLKQALLLLSLKLRCFLKQWRLGCKKDTEWKDVLEVWKRDAEKRRDAISVRRGVVPPSIKHPADRLFR